MANLQRVGLPAEVANEIIANTQTASAIMSLARNITVPGRGLAIPVVLGDPTAAWVGETEKKPVSDSTVQSKLLRPYKLAVIETFSEEMVRDQNTLYQALVERLPLALAEMFDSTVTGALGTTPGSDFDTFSSITAADPSTDIYDAFVAVEKAVAASGNVNGYALSPIGKASLLGAKDTTGRPIFLDSALSGFGGQILGSRAIIGNGIGKNTDIAFGGDWSQAVVGTVAGVDISVSDQATVGDINLWEQNMVAVRAEIEIGFRCNTNAFAKVGTSA